MMGELPLDPRCHIAVKFGVFSEDIEGGLQLGPLDVERRDPLGRLYASKFAEIPDEHLSLLTH